MVPGSRSEKVTLEGHVHELGVLEPLALRRGGVEKLLVQIQFMVGFPPTCD